jgi:3'-phosphoadenosine 5'-phosphosulfate sulfotransferase (PAPS reductase)/FAD synthetase
MTRKQDYIKNSCIRMGKRPLATPLAIWTEQDIWDYIKRHKVQTTDLYKMGYDRTGCAFCMFGVTREKYPNRFQRMYGTHPALHKTVCEKWGLRKVLEILDVDCYPNKNRCTTLRKQRDPNKTDQGPSPLSPT